MKEVINNPLLFEENRQKDLSVEKPVYSAEDLTFWKNGAEDYKKFAAGIKEINKYWPDHVASIKAMFLGEKPAVLGNIVASDNKEALEDLGFRFIGDYCYIPELVRKVIEKYKDRVIFETDDPELLVKSLGAKNSEHNVVLKGLILGFPLPSVLAYERVRNFTVGKVIKCLYDLLPPDEKKFLEANYYTDKRENNQEILGWLISKLWQHQQVLGLDQPALETAVSQLKELINAKQVGALGFNWVDYESSDESSETQRRLADAFEESGISS